MGGGRNHWARFDPVADKRGRADGRNLLNEMKEEGYTVVATKDRLTQAGSGKLIGLFSSMRHLEYELDQVAGKDADGNTYTTLVFGNGANRPNVRASVDSATATNVATPCSRARAWGASHAAAFGRHSVRHEAFVTVLAGCATLRRGSLP